MRNIEDIKKQPHICITEIYTEKDGTPTAVIGWCDYPDKKFKGSLIAGFDEDGFEHVSVSSFNHRQLPDWETMCRIKKAFFGDEEMAVQIHPKESEYVHSVGRGNDKLENVLHLWRPVGGKWSTAEKGGDVKERG